MQSLTFTLISVTLYFVETAHVPNATPPTSHCGDASCHAKTVLASSMLQRAEVLDAMTKASSASSVLATKEARKAGVGERNSDRECPKDTTASQKTFHFSELWTLWSRSSLGCRLSSGSCEIFDRKEKPTDDGNDAVLEALRSGEVVAMPESGIQSVGVIGAGPSGLMSAKYLKEIGLNVTVFEAGARVGGKANTWVDPDTGRAHDMATKWIPTVSASFEGGGKFILGAPPLQRKIIDEVKEVGLKVISSGGFSYLNTETGEEIKVPPIVQKYSKLKMAGDIVQGLNAFFAIAACPGVHGVVDCGVARPGESLQDWGERLDISAFSDILAEYVDGLGDGQAAAEFVGYPLKSRAYFLLVTMVQKLADQGVFENNFKGYMMRALLPPMGPWAESLMQGSTLAEIMKQPATVLFEQGYSGFWELFVQRYDLDVRLSESVQTVSKLSAIDQKVEVKTSVGSTYRFDHVIVAVPPSSAKRILPGEYSGSWEGLSAMPIEAVTWRATKNVDLGSPLPNIALYPESCEANLGGASGAVANGVAYAICNEYQDDVYVTLGYPGRNGTEWRTTQTAQLRKLLQTNVTPVATSYREWPAVALSPNYTPFHNWLEAHQGKDGLTYVGEEVSGNNVPAIMEDVASMFITKRWLQ